MRRVVRENYSICKIYLRQMKHRLKKMTFTLSRSVSLVICSTIFILTSCCNNTTSNNNQVLTDTSNSNKGVFLSTYPTFVVDKKYWSGTTPAGFLDTLTKYAGSAFFYVEEKPDSIWFKESDLVKLQNHCKDTSRASIVYTSYDSHLHDEPYTSTVRRLKIGKAVRGTIAPGLQPGVLV